MFNDSDIISNRKQMSTYHSFYVDTRFNVKKKLQASNNIGCSGFTFHCLNTHLPKLNITIPLCLQICP